MMKQKFADTAEPILVPCLDGSFKILKKQEHQTRFLYLMKLIKSDVIHTAILLQRCWKSWIRNKILHSTIILWNWITTCPKYFSLQPPTTFQTSRDRCVIVWRSLK